VADALALKPQAAPPGIYRQRGASSLQRLFRIHFPEFAAVYHTQYARRLGHSRLQRITRAVERFLECGDYTKGVARIRCTNPDCHAEYFRPFSCKVFHLCPSCSQKRTLLFGEYMNERLLLRLPHRQMVFTFPKVLRGFFRHHRTLYGEIARRVYAMILRFYNAAAGCRVHSAAVIAYASAGEFARFNPHLHAIVLEGGFDPSGRFLHVPQLDLARLSQYFRACMVDFFFKRQLINERLARNMLQWDHSGFSVDGSVRIPAGSARTREALAQYIARAPLSLSKLVVEDHAATVLYHTAYNPYFRTNQKLFRATDFIAELLQHLPDPRLRLIRRYGLYSSRSRGTWLRKSHLVRLAPEGWRQEHAAQEAVHIGFADLQCAEASVCSKESRAAWARLIAKVYEADPLICRHCGSPMRILAVITDPQQVRKILLHLIKTGKAPPGLDPASLN
jgi:hypothetical protein